MRISSLSSISALLLMALFLATPLAALATTTDPIIPACDPSLVPNTELRSDGTRGGTACDLAQFAVLLKNIIGYLTIIVFPIATIMIGYAGFIILTAGGSGERVQQGWKMIRIAITGVIILLASYIIIQFIFSALGVSRQFGGDLNVPTPVAPIQTSPTR